MTERILLRNSKNLEARQPFHLLSDGRAAGRPAIEFFSSTTGRVTEVAAPAKPFRPWPNPEGPSVSADGRWILDTQEDRWTSRSC